MEITKLQFNGKSYTLTLGRGVDDVWSIIVDDASMGEGPKTFSCRVINWSSQKNNELGGVRQDAIVFDFNGKLVKAKIVERVVGEALVSDVLLVNTGTIATISPVREVIPLPKSVGLFKPAICLVDQEPVLGDHDLVLKSPLAGLVIAVKVVAGQFVAKNQPVVVIESMKMENEICAPFPAFIKTLSISEGNLVKPNQVIVTFERRGGSGDAASKRFDGEEVFECRGDCSGT